MFLGNFWIFFLNVTSSPSTGYRGWGPAPPKMCVSLELRGLQPQNRTRLVEPRQTAVFRVSIKPVVWWTCSRGLLAATHPSVSLYVTHKTPAILSMRNDVHLEECLVLGWLDKRLDEPPNVDQESRFLRFLMVFSSFMITKMK